jgi:hypothetical protein
MRTAEINMILTRIDRLRTELIDQAFALDRRGCADAADVATSAAARLEELQDELSAARAETPAAAASNIHAHSCSS